MSFEFIGLATCLFWQSQFAIRYDYQQVEMWNKSRPFFALYVFDLNDDDDEW